MFKENSAISRVKRINSFLCRVTYPPFLPIVGKRDEIITAIKTNRIVIITGETGSGKTTQLPKMCLEAGRGLRGSICCSQPRRVAATSVAHRISQEVQEKVGTSVGYKIRFSECFSEEGLIKVVTDGVLLMEMQRDPLLRAYDTIIVDEAHERSINIDLILGIAKHLLSRREDLKLLVTSATIDTEKFSQYFNNAPVIEVSGRSYPVETRYRPIDRALDQSSYPYYLEAAIESVEEILKEKSWGDILVFMPTEQDIRDTWEILKVRLSDKVVILPLFARLSVKEQQQVFRPCKKRKIIIATNIAETSLTIPGIRYVIDTGLARILQYNPRTRISSLPVLPISRSSADQRKGRCGRLEHGICIRLYSEEDYLQRPLYTPPEIKRVNLAGVILKLLSLKIHDLEEFPFLDRPSLRNIRDSIELLRELGAIEVQGPRGTTSMSYFLTPIGRTMARMPLDPRLSRMILSARKEGCLKDIVILAAVLSIQDPRERPVLQDKTPEKMHTIFKDKLSDFYTFLNIWNKSYEYSLGFKSINRLRRFCREHFLSFKRMREWKDIHDQITSILAEEKLLYSDTALPKQGDDLRAAIHRSILSGHLGNIAQKKEGIIYRTAKGRLAALFPGSSIYDQAGEWIVAAEFIETSRLYARTAAVIKPKWLEEVGGNLCQRKYLNPRWDSLRGEVVASEQVTLFGFTISSGRKVSYSRINPQEAARIFIKSALLDGEIVDPPPFLIDNLALIKRFSEMEERLRRNDLLVGEEDLRQFYEARLSGVSDIRSLKNLIKERGSDSFLRMHETDILRKKPSEEELLMYPDTVAWEGWRFSLDYRFSPTDPNDGITLKIPFYAIPASTKTSFDWSVPGLVRERLMALLGSLPKSQRRQLPDIDEVCDLALSKMDRNLPLPIALSRFLSQEFSLNVSPEFFAARNMADHLKLRFSIIDDSGKELGSGRDLTSLVQGLALPAEHPSIVEAKRKWERYELTEWDFGDLPEKIPLSTSAGGTAYPALLARGDKVDLRLFLSAADAKKNHPLGVSGLLAHVLRRELSKFRNGIPYSKESRLWATAFGGTKRLEEAVLDKVMHDLFEVEVRSQAGFQQLVEQIRRQLFPYGQEILSFLLLPLKALFETSSILTKIENAYPQSQTMRDFLANLRREIEFLMPQDLLIRYNKQLLAHLPRYLRGIAIMAQRASLNLGRTLERYREVTELIAVRDKLVLSITETTSEERRRLIEDFIWMLEEYKISLFAQELKTAFPISRKRIDAKLFEIEESNL